MPYKLDTTIRNITSLPNSLNASLLSEFHQYMIANGSSERHQNNSLKAIVCFARGPNVSFLDICKREQVLLFLDTKIKNSEQDPEKKWINTWNDYARRIKRFLRWLHNTRVCGQTNNLEQTDWTTPTFAKIKEKRTKRLSPYSETELWERDEILSIIKYEPFKRNKAALMLFWDLNARNHEVTLLKIKHIRLKERYGEGDIPHEAKTGTGPILLTCSFPYVRDWLNEHPFRNEPDARLICNLITGSSEARSDVDYDVNDVQEKQKLEFLLKSKKWDPYCIRHSSITFDSDFLPEYALKKKVRWSMNSKQGARYIKRRMGNDLRQKILVQNGIISEQQIEKNQQFLTVRGVT